MGVSGCPGSVALQLSSAMGKGTVAVIEFRNACFGYGDYSVLTDVTLTLEAGRFYVLSGPSGAGKTTFLRLCTLEALPDSGEVLFFGDAAQAIDRDGVALLRRRMGMVHQDCKFLDHLPVRRNIALPLEIAGRSGPAQEADIHDLLAWVELTDRAEALPPELSGGERQRAALARAVMLSPDILIADEPTGNIDRDMALRILSLLVELNRLGRTILIATHDLELIRAAKAQVPTTMLRLSGGTIAQAAA